MSWQWNLYNYSKRLSKKQGTKKLLHLPAIGIWMKTHILKYSLQKLSALIFSWSFLCYYLSSAFSFNMPLFRCYLNLSFSKDPYGYWSGAYFHWGQERYYFFIFLSNNDIYLCYNFISILLFSLSDFSRICLLFIQFQCLRERTRNSLKEGREERRRCL